MARNFSPGIEFWLLQPPVTGDERYPGEVIIPIQVIISPVTASLQDQIDITITELGGTATGTAV